MPICAKCGVAYLDGEHHTCPGPGPFVRWVARGVPTTVWDRRVAIACTVAVFAAVVRGPRVGACGTVHYFLVLMLSVFVTPLAAFVNVVLFSVPVILLGRLRLGRAYSPLVIVWAALFSYSYLLAAPTGECP